MEKRKVALITGGAKRVGRAIALRLATDGFDIAFTFNTSMPAAMELAAEISRDGQRQALPIQA